MRTRGESGAAGFNRGAVPRTLSLAPALNTKQQKQQLSDKQLHACVVCIVCLQVITPFNVYFNAHLIFKKGEIWRLFTNFFFFGNLGKHHSNERGCPPVSGYACSKQSMQSLLTQQVPAAHACMPVWLICP